MNVLRKQVIRVTALLAAGALVLSGCAALGLVTAQPEPTPIPTVTSSGVVSAEGRLVPARWSALTFPVAGELGELLVSEGDQVAAGEPLARLHKREALEAALRQAELELLSAEQALKNLKDHAALAREQIGMDLVAARRALPEAQKVLRDLDTDDFRDELDDLNIAVKDARDDMSDAREDLQGYSDLDTDNPTRKNAQAAYDDAVRAYEDALYERDIKENQLEEAKAGVRLAQARLEDLQLQYDARQNGPDPDELALAEEGTAAAQAAVNAARRALENANLTAPYDGTIVDLNGLEPGEFVTPAIEVVRMADFSIWFVETRDLTELDVISIEAGQRAVVTPDALPELELDGEIESIDRFYSERSGDILYAARIRLKESDQRLRWGMTVTVTFRP